jgi:ATP-dependent Clp protease ATP-binding subunit ClpA
MSRVVRRPLSLHSQAIAKKAAQVAALYQHPYIDHAHILMAFLEVPNCATQAISANRSTVLERVSKRTTAFLHSLLSVRADKRGGKWPPR